MKSISFRVIYLLLTCFIMTSCTKKEEPPTSGLILYYSFNGNVNDGSENNNNGINNTSNKYVSGRKGQALDFNGTSDYIELTETINSENGLSFSFWLKSRGASGTENNGVIIGKYNMTADFRSFLIYSFGGGPGELTVFPSDPSLWTILNPKRLAVGTWTHCVVNVTGTTIEAWINGALCTKKQREYGTYFDSPDEPVFIGNNFALGGGTNNHFNGVLDELRIYNRGLTSDEIQILFKAK